MTSNAPTEACPICGGELLKDFHFNATEIAFVDCKNCGAHPARIEVLAVTRRWRSDANTMARIAYAVQRLPSGTLVTAELLADIERTTKLPTAQERVDNFLVHMASNEPGTPMDIDPTSLAAVIGADTPEGAKWAVKQAVRMGLIEGRDSPPIYGDRGWRLNDATLTVKGWEHHESLMRKAQHSRRAFMAMAFHDEDLWRVFRERMEPAVKATGFDLLTTADARVKKAGNIIARMKVEIHTSRFMVCDLTHGNQGAYWEAGFAEGLGRPVIYTCRADVMSDPDTRKRPHFDTAQQLIVKWDAANPDPGMQELKDVIRATLPAEAKMTDT